MNTPRLELHAATLEHLRTELNAPHRLSILLDARVSPEWPTGEYDRDAMEFFEARLLEGGTGAEGWYGWYAVRNENSEGPRELVGAGRYFGPPGPENAVEIGYSILPKWRRRGYASELVEALIHRTFVEGGVLRVIAHTTESNSGSVAVLMHCGFRPAGPGAEPGSIRFELDYS